MVFIQNRCHLSDGAVLFREDVHGGGMPLLFLFKIKWINGGTFMELSDVRNTLENTAEKLADFRGSL
ncbi:hypothetical protein ACFPOH_01235 [Ureibacillus suwonensis]|jgi:hypothetical protein|uniref:Uncharacterized protein n=1 Tax=Ureibacillus suwonensis TaxID=313007 RepID=A0ABW0R7R6_9BACL